MPRIAWLILALLLAGSSYGWNLNDEADQAAALYSMSQGSFRVEEQTARTYAVQENLSIQRRWDDTPVASTPLNLLALPVIPALLVLDAMAPLSLWFGAAAAVATWRALGLSLPTFQPFIRHRLQLVGLVGIILLANAGFRAQGPDVQFYYPVIALQVTNLVVAGGVAFLMWRLVCREVVNPLGGQVALLAVLGGSWLFWAQGLKYHMLGAWAIAALLVLLARPRTTRRDVLIGLTAGFAAWVNLGIGLVAISALVLLEAPRLWTERRALSHVARQWGVLALAGLIGMAPMFVENTVIFGHPLKGFYLAPLEEVAGWELNGTAKNESDLAPSFWGGLTKVLHWEGAKDFALNLVSVLTFGTRVEGKPLGVFLVTPFLALSILGLRSIRRAQSHHVFAVLVLAMQTLLLTNASVRQGAGHDARLWFHVLPVFALLACLGARPFLARLGEGDRRLVTTMAVGFLVFVYGSLAILARLNLRIGVSVGEYIHNILLATVALAAIFVALAWASSLRHGEKRKAIALTAAVLIAAPLSWAVMHLVVQHSEIPRTGEHAGGEMFVPGMNPVSEWFKNLVDPDTAPPLVFDGEGNLVYHPDYGRCDVEPYPCPPEVMERLRNPAFLNTTSTA